MKIHTLAHLAVKHTRNHFAEEIYLKTGRDVTKPITFYGLVNERCNVRCRYCEYWRLKEYKDEMSIEEWKQALLSVQDFVGKFSISFSGGEPFIKKGFVDLLAWCRSVGIEAGVTTNGSALTEKIAAKTVAARPLNVNVSCDAPNAEVHDYLRGHPGLFNALSAGIGHLLAEQKRQGIDFPIMIKPTINSKNFRLMPDIVRWAEDIGATVVNFQPMDRWTPETIEELWIEEEDLPDLQRVLDEVCEMKADGHAIMNSEEVLQLMVPHFREENAPPEVGACRVGLRDFFIRTNGDIELCFFYPTVGNIKEHSARELWYGEKAQEIRRQTVECTKLCLYTCLSQKTLLDKVSMGLSLVKGKKKAPKDTLEPV